MGRPQSIDLAAATTYNRSPAVGILRTVGAKDAMSQSSIGTPPIDVIFFPKSRHRHRLPAIRRWCTSTGGPDGSHSCLDDVPSVAIVAAALAPRWCTLRITSR